MQLEQIVKALDSVDIHTFSKEDLEVLRDTCENIVIEADEELRIRNANK